MRWNGWRLCVLTFRTRGNRWVRYFGFYSNVARGKRKKKDEDGLIPSILEPDGSTKEHKRNWARLIQKIYEIDPLCCPGMFRKNESHQRH